MYDATYPPPQPCFRGDRARDTDVPYRYSHVQDKLTQLWMFKEANKKQIWQETVVGLFHNHPLAGDSYDGLAKDNYRDLRNLAVRSGSHKCASLL